MNLYAILRRSGWRSAEELEQAAARSTRVGDEEMPDEVSPEAIRKHASSADLPVDEIIPIGGTVVVRPDPEPAAAR
jgi:hypothetical protein